MTCLTQENQDSAMDRPVSGWMVLATAGVLLSAVTACRCQSTTTEDAPDIANVAEVSGVDRDGTSKDTRADTPTRPLTDITATDGDAGTPDAADGQAETETTVATPCLTAGEGTNSGLVQVPALTEASGLAASHTHDGIFWTHNDSGDTATIFAIDANGKLRGTYSVVGAAAIDWEDIARAPASITIDGQPQGEHDRIIVADVGDNLATRDAVTLYVIDEPAPGSADEPAVALTAAAVAIPYSYPDGPQDAEGIAVAPTIDGVTADAEVYILSKAWSSGISTLFRYPAPLRPNETVTVETVGTIALDNLGGGLSFLATAMDISPSGNWLVVRTYENVLAWPRPAGMPMAAALTQTRCAWSQQSEPQGEAITFSADGSAYFTLSERKDQPLWRFALTPGAGATP